jgi:hypothetical protein
MKEYWINVYDDKYYGAAQWPTLSEAVTASMASLKYIKVKTLYRIHVRMK